MSEPTGQPAAPDVDDHRQRHRWISAGVIVALLALGGLAYWATHRSTAAADATAAGGAGAGAPGPGGPGGPPGAGGRRGALATTVGTAVAEQIDVPVMLEALGTVTPTATVTVMPQVSGTIARVLYREGQLVKAGQVLVNIDPRSFQNALMQSQGNLQRDQAALASARLTLARYQTLLKQDSIAEQEVDSQAATVKQLEGTVMADQGELNAAKLNVSYTNIVAPLSGRVGLRTVDVGNYVAAGSATGVAVITVMDPIDVEFAIPQDQIPVIMKRLNTDKGALSATALDRTRVNTLAQGKFLTLDNRVDTSTGTVKAKAQFPNQDGSLFPNQFVNVRVLIDTLKQAVAVPTGAVRQGATGDFVYVLDTSSSTVAMRAVKTSQSSGNKVVLSQGLQAGETVVTEGADRLKEGAKVRTASARPGNGPPGTGPPQAAKGQAHKKRDRQAPVT